MADTLPIGCRERYNAIVQISEELFETWINGNRKDVAAALAKLELPAALAVLALMMEGASSEERTHLTRFFIAVA